MDNYSSMKLEFLALKWAMAEKFRELILAGTWVTPLRPNWTLRPASSTYPIPNLHKKRYRKRGAIFEKYNITFHCYANDIQIYFELADDLAVSLHYFQECMREVKEWFLTFAALGPFANSSCDYVSNLGVLLDSSFKLDKQVYAVVRSSFHQLRLISKPRHYVPHEDLEKLIHAFETSRLDYCNSLYYGLPSSLLLRLQTVQNAAARLLTGTRKFCPITLVLAGLHWLPIKCHIQFKILLLTFKTINKLALSYLSELLKPHTPARTLRSEVSGLLVVPRVFKSRMGGRAFSFQAPLLWNQLPVWIQETDTISTFKIRLQTFLFAKAYI
ncbi:uncharacterized protein LOC102206753 [Pundamilia nyererei]|uniref:Uncharacterized protein LOC102206753 n=1 Tax=Pundamilia nyererei TaxID=303518 RepID=A0A9Y6M336_9CICH|nr:PREDICTED: uncharacterized protein LOC102206753 [Pundamilia nyererei]